ncbi:MAG: galactokinase [Anaerolineales bacterium]|nr:galactokinase [Anaerolineales bacterium]
MDLIASFNRCFGKQPVLLAHAPGRVNLLGEHVDYNDGPVLPVALDRVVRLAAAPSGDDVVSLSALDLGESVAFKLAELEQRIDIQGQPLPGWALYPAGIAWSLQSDGLPVSGMQAAYTSNVPIGAGLSSSAAVEVVFSVTWQALGGWEADRMRLARLCQRADNVYIGIASGLMDQFASAHGKEGHALYFDTRSLEWEAIPLPAAISIVIADSGVRRALVDSEYNERRAACEKAVDLLRQYKPDMRSLRDISPQEFAAFSEFLPPIIRRRAEHVVQEIARVQSAVVALRLKETESFGALMYSGHASLRDLYQVSTPELDALVEIARDLPGCYGARLTGAGFGGCTVNLVHESHTEEFISGLSDAYKHRTGLPAQVYACKASAGAFVERLS